MMYFDTGSYTLEVPESEGGFMGLSANNTVSDVVAELYDEMFREILGDDIMDSTLGSFSRGELFRIMSKVFLQDANKKIYDQIMNN